LADSLVEEGMVIVRTLEVGPFASNCYIVGDEPTKEGMIVDPGAEAERITKAVGELKLDIKVIVLTHGHIDHINALARVKEATGAVVAIHAEDAAFLKAQPRNLMFGLTQQAVEPDRLLKGGDSIEFGGMGFLVVHTPGHSRGSICLLGHGVVFSGDTLFNYGIGRYDLPGGDYDQIMNSLHTKLMVLPDNTIALTLNREAEALHPLLCYRVVEDDVSRTDRGN
jgi:hydroxyacylglutathione hydrolase